MTPEIIVHAASCRGCELCVDVCPTHVLALDPATRVSVVEHAEDCIACLSCAYICPSTAITHVGFHVVKNFYRDAAFTSKMARFL